MIHIKKNDGSVWNNAEDPNGGATDNYDLLAAGSTSATLFVTDVAHRYYTGVYTSSWAWTQRTVSGSPNFYAIASSADGATLVGVVNGGYIYISKDTGANWTRTDSSTSKAWVSVSMSADGTRITATNTSNGGETWTFDTN